MEKRITAGFEESQETMETIRTEGKKDILASKKKGDSHLVAILVIIVITLALCYIFKNEVEGFMTDAFQSLGEKMKGLLTNLK